MSDYLNLLREIKSVAFATVDERNSPQVRIADVMIVEDDKLYFVISRGKAFYDEVTKTKRVAIAGLSKDYKMVRLRGKVKKAPKEMLDKVFKLNPAMNDVYPNESRRILDVFCIQEGEGELLDLNKKPIEREEFVLGKGNTSKTRTFKITNKCVECGKCKKICPQKCIKKRSPYKISQKNCIHCGLCFEKCHKKAIAKKG